MKHSDCTPEECSECTYARKQMGQRQKLDAVVPVENNGEVTTEALENETEDGFYSETADPNLVALNVSDGPWVVDHSDDPRSRSRSDLQAIKQTLSKHKPGRDRRFTIEFDGSIVYAQEEGEWEPPRDIRGYERDPENEWRFIPLWPRCSRRQPKGKRTGSCGCIQITMTCVNLDSELNREKVSHKQCQHCLVRADQMGE